MTPTLDLILQKLSPLKQLILVTDGHRQYQRSVDRHDSAEKIDHRRYPNPKRGPKGSPRSRAARRRDAAMSVVDHAHGFIRHSASHHRRETIAFARRHSSLVGSLFHHTVWLNLAKRWIEQDLGSGTRAMRVGLTNEPWDWERILAQRLMPHEVKLPPAWEVLYFRQLRYPEPYERWGHLLKLAR